MVIASWRALTSICLGQLCRSFVLMLLLALAILAGTQVFGQTLSQPKVVDIEEYNWKSSIGESGGSPIVYEDKLIVGTNNSARLNPNLVGDRGILACFDRTTGKFLWQVAHERLGHRAHDLPMQGIKTRPFLDGDSLFYVNNRGELIRVELKGARGGKEPRLNWKLDMFNDLKTFRRDACDIGNQSQSPIVIGELVFCVTGNGSLFGYEDQFPGKQYVPRPSAPSFIAANKRTGKVVWQSSLPGDRLMYGQWSSPAPVGHASAQQILFPGGDGSVYSFSPDGKKLFSVDLNDVGGTPWGLRRRGTRSFPSGEITVHKSIAIVSIGQDLESPCYGQCSICAVNCAEGARQRIKWRYMNKSFGSCSGNVTIGSDDIVYALSTSGIVVALDLQTGKEIGRLALGIKAGQFSAPVMVGKTLIIPAYDCIITLSAGPKMTKLGTFNLDARILGTPALTKDTIYVATEGMLWSIPIKAFLR